MTTPIANARVSANRVALATLGLAGLVGFTGLVLAGCSRPLLSPTEERTPFDRYDAMRAQHAPQYVENEYGRREPNLRGRLSPKN